ncbi:MAG: hypothetical protein J6P44_01475 [Bacteroidales bacterium]|nr:hypothetical protein [Bacteroidales bacterium]
MKKIIIRLLAAAVLLTLTAATLNAQNNSLSENAKIRVRQKVAQMNDYISIIGSKKFTIGDRQYHIPKCLNLFVARGQAYEEYIDDYQTKRREGVLMQTTSTKRKGADPNDQLMRNYLPRLANLRYQNVDISSTKWTDIQVSNIKHIEGNYYQATAYYEQTFIATNDGRYIYGDKTKKHIVCHIFLEESDAGVEWRILLGDVEASDTEIIR